MSQRLRLASNEADVAQVATHLRECDALFVPPLNGRVDLDGYADKLVTLGMRFEAWSGDGLVGLVAVYCNASDRHTAFITSVSVLPRWQGQGIAVRLLEQCIAHVRARGFARIELDVDAENLAALSLYEKMGFVTGDASRRPLQMTLHWEREA